MGRVVWVSLVDDSSFLVPYWSFLHFNFVSGAAYLYFGDPKWDTDSALLPGIDVDKV